MHASCLGTKSWLLILLALPNLLCAQAARWPSGGPGIPNYTGANSWGVSYNSTNQIPKSFIPFAAPGSIGTITPAAGQFNSLVNHGLSGWPGNEFFGVGAGGSANTTGGLNSAFGEFALASLSSGTSNVAVGQVAALSLTTGSQNVAVGNNALTYCSTCFWNTAVGYGALGNGVINGVFPAGSENTAVGWQSLFSLTTGAQNTAIGENSMGLLTTGSYNTTVGADSQSENTTGSFNTTFGHDSMTGSNPPPGAAASCAGGPFQPYTATSNTAIGEGAFCTSTTGVYNTVVGWQSGVGLKSGNDNTFLGTYAGSVAIVSSSNGTGNDDTYVGFNAGPGSSSSAMFSNSTALGSNARVTGSNQMVFGNAQVTQVVMPAGVSITSLDTGSPSIAFGPDAVTLNYAGVSGTPSSVVATVPSAVITSASTQPLAPFYTTGVAGQYQICAQLSVKIAGSGPGTFSDVIAYTSDQVAITIELGSAVPVGVAAASNIGVSANNVPNCITTFLDPTTPVSWGIQAAGAINAPPTLRYGFKLIYLGP